MLNTIASTIIEVHPTCQLDGLEKLLKDMIIWDDLDLEVGINHQDLLYTLDLRLFNHPIVLGWMEPMNEFLRQGSYMQLPELRKRISDKLHAIQMMY